MATQSSRDCLDITESKCSTCNRDMTECYCENHDYVGCADETLNTTMLSKVKSFGSIGIKVVQREEAPIKASQSDDCKHESKAQVKYT